MSVNSSVRTFHKQSVKYCLRLFRFYCERVKFTVIHCLWMCWRHANNSAFNFRLCFRVLSEHIVRNWLSCKFRWKLTIPLRWKKANELCMLIFSYTFSIHCSNNEMDSAFLIFFFPPFTETCYKHFMRTAKNWWCSMLFLITTTNYKSAYQLQ